MHFQFSLWDSPVILLLSDFDPSGFQFSLWDSSYRGRVNKPTPLAPFNSLYEIQNSDDDDEDEDELAFNSLYEIPKD